jgi:ACS family hexuronate transporter-like MFS transporter
MIGASEAGNWPAAAKMISEWFPSKERALASGIFNSGASVAALVSFPLIAWIVVHWGWKSAFVTMSLFGFLWIIAWWFFAPKQSGVGVIVPKRVPARELLSTRFVIVFTISKAFMDPAWYFFVFWFPKYLSSTFHFTLREIGWKGSAPYVTAFLGNIAGGALTALFIRLGVANSTARKISTTLFALAMTSIIPASFTTNAPVAIALVSLTTFGYTGCLANALAFPAEVFPKHAVASVYGLASMGSGLGGILFSYLAGHLIEHYHSYQQVFIGYGIMPLVFLFCILFLLGPLKPNPKFQEPEAQAA